MREYQYTEGKGSDDQVRHGKSKCVGIIGNQQVCMITQTANAFVLRVNIILLIPQTTSIFIHKWFFIDLS